jgi:LmbE family N-acetylglucosaminyl deacetylase
MTHGPTPTEPPLLAFGAHPDDIEFACGGIVARETRAGRPAHLVICSRGEAASNGTPELRKLESDKSAAILGASHEILQFDGDAKLEVRTAHTLKLARIIRRVRPAIILAPSLVENQHPDHPRLGRLVRDAARLARYGGLDDLRGAPPHAVDHLLYYASSPDAEPSNCTRIFFDVSAPEILTAWKSAMEAHASQMKTRNYVELHLAMARVHGLSAGVEYAIALYSEDPILVDSLKQLGRSSRRF